MRNSTLLFNYANNRPHNSISLEQVCFLEGVSFIFNQICKKCTKLGKNIALFIHLSAEKCTKINLSAKSVQILYKEVNTHKYFIIHKPIFFMDRLLTETVSGLSFLFSKQGKAPYRESKKYINNFKGVKNGKRKNYRI